MTDAIGYLAAVLTTLSFLPQAVLILRTGRTESISLTMYAMFTTGVGAWLAYGLMEGAIPVVIANAVTLLLALTILGLKLRAVLQARASVQGAADATSAPIA